MTFPSREHRYSNIWPRLSARVVIEKKKGIENVNET